MRLPPRRLFALSVALSVWAIFSQLSTTDNSRRQQSAAGWDRCASDPPNAASGTGTATVGNPAGGDNAHNGRDIYDVWRNDRDVVHVVHTRFMQHQPDLLRIGAARLKLFETFCVPTLAGQTDGQFLWIIRTDPDLHRTLVQGLIEAVRGMPNAVVVGSNAVRKGSVDGGFRNPAAIDHVTPESTLFGSVGLVRSYHDAAKNRTLLETNLDADDGLALTFMERTQRLALEKFGGVEKNNGWLQICAGRHLEWHFFAPWDKATDRGSLHLGSTHICVTPGLTWATQPDAEPEFITAHHVIKRDMSQCGQRGGSATERGSAAVRGDLGCWVEIPVSDPENDVIAIRARTPTSTGMNRVVLLQSPWSAAQVTTDNQSWPLLERFGISQGSVKDARRFLRDNLEALVEENLRGQCKEDHSCSEGINKQLKMVIPMDGRWKNRHGVVHVIHTSLRLLPTSSAPSASLLAHTILDIWRDVCLLSLETQTVYEFLWIVRVDGFMDSSLRDKLLNPIRKSPLNILVVESNRTLAMDIQNPRSVFDKEINETILHGDSSTLGEFSSASRNRTLLQTSIGANEAIIKTFVADLQNSTAIDLKEDRAKGEFYRCFPEHLEWNYFAPQGDEVEHGFLNLMEQNDGNCTRGPATTKITPPWAESLNNERAAVPIWQCSAAPTASEDGCFARARPEKTQTLRVLIPKSLQPPAVAKLEPK